MSVKERTLGRSVPAGRAAAGTRSGGRLTIILALLALYLIWGSTYLGIRIAIEGFPPLLMAGGRFAIAGLGLYLFMRLRGVPNPSLRQWRNAAAIGFLLLVIGNGGVTFAEQWVPSGLAAVAIATMPLWAALFAGLWGRWPRRVEWIGLAVGFVGVVLLNLENGLRANPLGAALLLLSPICWALGSTWSRHLDLPTSFMGSAAEMLVAGIAMLVGGLLSGERLAGPPSTSSILAVLYLIIFGSIVAYSAYLFLLSRVRPTLATSYAYVNPVVAVALGAFLVNESVSPLGLAAMAIIVLGVVLVLAARQT